MDRRNSTPCEVQFRELRLDGKPRRKKRLRKKKEPVEAAGPEVPLAPPSRAPKAVIDPTNLAAAQNLFFENPTVNPVQSINHAAAINQTLRWDGIGVHVQRPEESSSVHGAIQSAPLVLSHLLYLAQLMGCDSEFMCCDSEFMCGDSEFMCCHSEFMCCHSEFIGAAVRVLEQVISLYGCESRYLTEVGDMVRLPSYLPGC